MRSVTISTIFYFGLTLFWKLYAKIDTNLYDINTVNYWINAYWFYNSLFYCNLFYKISFNGIGFQKTILRCIAAYWGVMLCLHTYIWFNIKLYDDFVKSANKLTVGATFIIISLVWLTYKLIKYDKGYER